MAALTLIRSYINKRLKNNNNLARMSLTYISPQLIYRHNLLYDHRETSEVIAIVLPPPKNWDIKTKLFPWQIYVHRNRLQISRRCKCSFSFDGSRFLQFGMCIRWQTLVILESLDTKRCLAIASKSLLNLTVTISSDFMVRYKTKEVIEIKRFVTTRCGHSCY